MLQHAFNGHGWREARVVVALGIVVPGTCGPQIAEVTAAGKGAWPVLMHISWPT